MDDSKEDTREGGLTLSTALGPGLPPRGGRGQGWSSKPAKTALGLRCHCGPSLSLCFLICKMGTDNFVFTEVAGRLFPWLLTCDCTEEL